MNPKYTKKIKDALEKRIETNVCDYAKDRGFVSRKFTSPSQRSVPDRIFFFKGVAFFIEFKRFGKRPTESQLKEHEKLRAAGMRVYVVDNTLDGRDLIDSIFLVLDIQRPGHRLPRTIYWASYSASITNAEAFHP